MNGLSETEGSVLTNGFVVMFKLASSKCEKKSILEDLPCEKSICIEDNKQLTCLS